MLLDNTVTREEATYIASVIEELLNPVESLKEQVYSVANKRVCLSGNFAYGKKPDVAKYIAGKGGIIDSNVTKSTDILVIGDLECQFYSNGNYGTKVKNALEYNEKGCNIHIIKESDLFSQAM